MYKIQDFAWFINEILAPLSGHGRLFARKAGQDVEIWWVDHQDRPTLLTDPQRFAARLLAEPALSAALHTATDRQLASPFWHALCRDLLATPESILGSGVAVCSYVLTRPGIIYVEDQYQTPRRGFSPYAFSAVAPPSVTPAGGMPPSLAWFFQQIGLDRPSQARVLAFYASVIIRDCFAAAPALLIRSPWKGTGKSSIARLGSYLAAGRPEDTALRWPGADDELAKALPALGSEKPYIWLDNVVAIGRPLGSEIINQGTQLGQYSARVLGRSALVQARRPIFVVTMQGGLIEEDLLDRLQIVSIDHPPPARITHATNIQVFITDHWERVRDELFALVLSTRPLPPNFEWPEAAGASAFRFPEWYRFVAPVVSAAALDPVDLLASTLWHESRAELQELMRLLARESDRAGPAAYFGVHEIIQKIPKYGFSALQAACSEALDMPTRHAALRTLLRALPTTLVTQYGHYELETRGDTYRVRIVAEGHQ